VITGTAWLAPRGSVGRPDAGDIIFCDADGVEVPPGTAGADWLRSGRDRPTSPYVGAEPRRRDGGWESLGDHGHLDEDGYLYLGDRIQDMILVGGANVYPAEVEAALAEHPAVRSVVVIGLPDDDTGNRVHAIVEADPLEVPAGELQVFAADRLARYKLPRTVEHDDAPFRDDAGKVRRAALRAARTCLPRRRAAT
jgi:bile acid-coenzyme A ligase